MIRSDHGLLTRSRGATGEAHGESHSALGFRIAGQPSRDQKFRRDRFGRDGAANGGGVEAESLDGASGGRVGIGHEAKQQVFLPEK